MKKSIEDVLQGALAMLNQARTPKSLAAAHQRVQAAIRAQRRHAQTEFGPLAQTYVAAMDIWDAQKADGVSKHDRLACLEKTIRASWPFTREWKFLCSSCSDYGLRMAECPGDATCGRPGIHGPHEYGTPCWCKKGAQFMPKSMPKPDEKSTEKQSKKLTKIGR